MPDIYRIYQSIEQFEECEWPEFYQAFFNNLQTRLF